MTSLLEKKSVLYTLIGAAVVVLIVIAGSLIGQNKPAAPVQPAVEPAQPTAPVTAPPSPAAPAPVPLPAPPQNPTSSSTIDSNLKAASDALTKYGTQNGDLNPSALDQPAVDLDAGSKKLAP